MVAASLRERFACPDEEIDGGDTIGYVAGLSEWRELDPVFQVPPVDDLPTSSGWFLVDLPLIVGSEVVTAGLYVDPESVDALDLAGETGVERLLVGFDREQIRLGAPEAGAIVVDLGDTMVFAGWCATDRLTLPFDRVFGERAQAAISAIVDRAPGSPVDLSPFEPPTPTTLPAVPQHVPGLPSDPRPEGSVDATVWVIALGDGTLGLDADSEAVCLRSAGVLGPCVGPKAIEGSIPLWAAAAPGAPIEVVVQNAAAGAQPRPVASFEAADWERGTATIAIDDRGEVTTGDCTLFDRFDAAQTEGLACGVLPGG